MSIALKLYEQLTEASDDKARARLIAEAFERLEERYPEAGELATRGQLRETELRLQKEIREVELRLQKEIKQVEAGLRKDIEAVRLEIKQVEAGLRRDIEALRLGIKQVEVRFATALHRQTIWIIGAVAAIVGLFRLLDMLIAG